MTALEKDLNEIQLEAVKSENPNILILAGAGSGKTRTLTNRIAYLIEKRKVNPASILAVTFTNKAAREMKDRVASLLNTEVSKLWIGTFHSMFARILRIESDHLAFARNFTIYDTDDQVNAIKKVMSSLNIPQQLYSPKLFQSKISNAKNRLIFPDDMERDVADPTESIIPDVYQRYMEYLKENNAMDFDDLLIMPIDLFDRNPDILKKYQKMFKHILIDEYQDTNKAQYTVINRLVNEKNNLCVVGDEDQSIYRWRGADINNILNFNQDYPKCRSFSSWKKITGQIIIFWQRPMLWLRIIKNGSGKNYGHSALKAIRYF